MNDDGDKMMVNIMMIMMLMKRMMLTLRMRLRLGGVIPRLSLVDRCILTRLSSDTPIPHRVHGKA